MLEATGVPPEPIHVLVIYTTLSLAVIGAALLLARRTSLGAPLLEGFIPREERVRWARRVLAISVLAGLGGGLVILLLNLSSVPGFTPAVWKMLLASLDAGVQEEIFYRFLVVTLLVWLGGLVWHDGSGEAAPWVVWAAIAIAGVVFGWAHVDDHLAREGVAVSALVPIMWANTILGIGLGFLYWRFGLEVAIVTHVLIDCVGIGVLVPVYLSTNTGLQLLVALLLMGIAVAAWYQLKRDDPVARRAAGRSSQL